MCCGDGSDPRTTDGDIAADIEFSPKTEILENRTTSSVRKARVEPTQSLDGASKGENTDLSQSSSECSTTGSKISVKPSIDNDKLGIAVEKVEETISTKSSSTCSEKRNEDSSSSSPDQGRSDCSMSVSAIAHLRDDASAAGDSPSPLAAALTSSLAKLKGNSKKSDGDVETSKNDEVRTSRLSLLAFCVSVGGLGCVQLTQVYGQRAPRQAHESSCLSRRVTH